MGDVILTGFWLIVGSLSVALGLGVYGLPTIVAIIRKSPNIALIVTVNLVLGALVVPWWIALGMALWSTDRRSDVTVIQTTTMPPAPHAVLHTLAQSGPSAPAQGALPAAPPAQPPAQPPGLGFAPPSPYGAASPASQHPSSGQRR